VAGKRNPSKTAHDLLVKPGSAPGFDQGDPGVRIGAADKDAGVARLQEVVERLNPQLPETLR
jgi:hypothetical protein